MNGIRGFVSPRRSVKFRNDWKRDGNCTEELPFHRSKKKYKAQIANMLESRTGLVLQRS
jgi:hypothetical protein